MCIHLLEHKKGNIQKQSFTEADFKILLLSLPLTLRVYQTHFFVELDVRKQQWQHLCKFRTFQLWWLLHNHLVISYKSLKLSIILRL